MASKSAASQLEIRNQLSVDVIMSQQKVLITQKRKREDCRAEPTPVKKAKMSDNSIPTSNFKIPQDMFNLLSEQAEEIRVLKLQNASLRAENYRLQAECDKLKVGNAVDVQIVTFQKDAEAEKLRNENHGLRFELDYTIANSKLDLKQRPKRKNTRASKEVAAKLFVHFQKYSTPTQEQISEIAKELGLQKKYVSDWFQNRRNEAKKKGIATKIKPTCKCPAEATNRHFTPAELDEMRALYDQYAHPNQDQMQEVANKICLPQKKVARWFCQERNAKGETNKRPASLKKNRKSKQL